MTGRIPAHRLLPVLASILATGLLLQLTACDEIDSGSPTIGWEPCPDCDTLVIDGPCVWGPVGGPVLLDRDVRVTPDGTLFVLPGTEIVLVPESVCVWDPAGNMWRSPRILVQGGMYCVGSPDSLIVFDEPGVFTSWETVCVSGGEGNDGRVWIGWSRMRRLYVCADGAVVAHSDIDYLDAYGGCGTLIRDNTIMYAGLTRFDGTFTDNRLRGMSICGGSPTVSGNTFEPHEFNDYAAIVCRCGTRAAIDGNRFVDRTSCIVLYGASPSATGNDFISSGPAVIVYGETTPGVPDTLDFADNWWGTTSIIHVPRRIVYERTDLQWPLTYVDYRPYAFAPFFGR